MRVIAYYLPQYHQIEENDMWWGKGFTEWTNVKAGKPLYPGHEQPITPQNKNYYSLEDKETLRWQSELANQHGIYGFAYYHYWFNGKKLLQKPAEQLLQWRDIDQKFFFFWANHSWVKTANGEKEILMQQVYGGERDAVAHYEYLSSFFKDERYIKVDNKPVVGIYKPSEVDSYKEMVAIWNRLAIDDGFDGVYIIRNVDRTELLKDDLPGDAVVLRQPAIAQERMMKNYGRMMSRPWLQRILAKKLPYRIDYRKVIKELIAQAPKLKKDCQFKLYQGTYTGWDNTVRHGKRGYVHENSNPVDFKKSLEALDEVADDDDFVFVNAWNEWAEGMHLEPDEKWGLLYLEAINDVTSRNVRC